MLYEEQIIQALESKKALFRDAQQNSVNALDQMNQALSEVVDLSREELESRLGERLWPGASPTAEQDTQPFVIEFPECWQNHEEARAWAKSVLSGVTTFAADGSQISAARDISLPVGVVQVGWFENRHVDDGIGAYVKNVEVEVLAPGELTGKESDYADQEVEWRRFHNELHQAEKFLLAHADQPERAMAFVDGSLIVSFAGQLKPERQQMFICAVEHLLDISEQTRVPLVGYVDTSYATDLASMLSIASGDDEFPVISDAAILRPRLERWGDRCRLYACARSDRVLPVDGGKYYRRVHFTYLKTTTENPPARVELPEWVLNDGRVEQVLDWIRADCVVGTGYPYTLETADAVAVLSAEDRAKFLALFQQFAEHEHIPLHFSRKVVSKRQRRI